MEAQEESTQEQRGDGLSRRALLNTAGAVGGTVLAASMLSGTASAQTPGAPITANRFSLVVNGQEIAAFSELSGITAEVEAVDYWQTGSNGPAVTKPQAGKLKPPTIVLRRAMGGGMELWAWHEAVRSGQAAAARRSCSLIMFANTGRPVAKYFLTNAWPAKIELTGLKAGANDVLMETITLTAEAIQRVAP
jgi:phage tail-like protein